MSLMRGQPKVEGGCPGTTSSTSVIAPTPTQPADLPSPFEVQEIPLEEATRKAPEASSKRLTKAPIGQQKKAKVPSRHKSRREGEKSKSRVANGKEPAAPVEETPTLRARSKSVELCGAHSEEDARDFHVIWVSRQSERAPDTPLEVDLTPLMHEMTQVHEMENELLKLTRAMDALRVDIPKQAIEDYKKSPGFEMGLIRMGRVSLEYGYQLALARLQA
ncbi:hypothetical protein GW17_00040584 [Ensete ventricosum]|nr:hypothetical protein GW17_00040584 [Ensete ventricosum]